MIIALAIAVFQVFLLGLLLFHLNQLRKSQARMDEIRRDFANKLHQSAAETKLLLDKIKGTR